MIDPTRSPAHRRESALQKKLGLSDMLDVPSFNEVVKGFVELYKIGIKVFDERGDKLSDIKVGNGDFCGYVFSFPEGRRRCTATVGRVKSGPMSEMLDVAGAARSEAQPRSGLVEVPCFTGLRYLVMPILWEGDTLGRIIFGPFVPENLVDFPKTLTEISNGLELSTLKEHVAKIRRSSEATITKVMIHFAQILETMIAAGQKMYLTSQLHIEATFENNRDLDERNQKLEAMNTRLKELDRLKSSFLATVSHELRTPLTSIIGYSEMLAEGLAGPMNAEQTDYVRTIMDKGETLLKLISSILDISQIEAGKVRLTFEATDLGELLVSALSSLRPQAQKKGVALESKVSPASPRQVHADREKLRQVLVNLLANAVKFTPKGGKVSLSLSELGPQPELSSSKGYRLMVEDSGVGIQPDQFEKIFQSFYQVDNSSTREFGGAGLGLAIVKSFVEGHGGIVRVTSEIGKGSCFIAILPEVPPSPTTLMVTPPSMAPENDRF